MEKDGALAAAAAAVTSMASAANTVPPSVRELVLRARWRASRLSEQVVYDRFQDGVLQRIIAGAMAFGVFACMSFGMFSNAETKEKKCMCHHLISADWANPSQLFAVKTFADQTAYRYETRVTEHMGPLAMIYLFYAKGLCLLRRSDNCPRLFVADGAHRSYFSPRVSAVSQHS